MAFQFTNKPNCPPVVAKATRAAVRLVTGQVYVRRLGASVAYTGHLERIFWQLLDTDPAIFKLTQLGPQNLKGLSISALVSVISTGVEGQTLHLLVAKKLIGRNAFNQLADEASGALGISHLTILTLSEVKNHPRRAQAEMISDLADRAPVPDEVAGAIIAAADAPIPIHELAPLASSYPRPIVRVAITMVAHGMLEICGDVRSLGPHVQVRRRP